MGKAMEKGAQSYPGQVLAAGGTQVAHGRDESCPRAGRKCPRAGQKLPAGGRGQDPKSSSPPSRSIYQAKIGSTM